MWCSTKGLQASRAARADRRPGLPVVVISLAPRAREQSHHRHTVLSFPPTTVSSWESGVASYLSLGHDMCSRPGTLPYRPLVISITAYTPVPCPSLLPCSCESSRRSGLAPSLLPYPLPSPLILSLLSSLSFSYLLSLSLFFYLSRSPFLSHIFFLFLTYFFLLLFLLFSFFLFISIFSFFLFPYLFLFSPLLPFIFSLFLFLFLLLLFSLFLFPSLPLSPSPLLLLFLSFFTQAMTNPSTTDATIAPTSFSISATSCGRAGTTTPWS